MHYIINMAHTSFAAYLNAEIVLVVTVDGAFDIGSLSPPTSWDLGPRLDHENGTGR